MNRVPGAARLASSISLILASTASLSSTAFLSLVSRSALSALAALLFSASRFSAESAISLYCCDDVRELASCCFRLPHSFLLWFSCSCRSL